MTLKQKALLQTVGIILTILFGSIAVQILLATISAEVLTYAFATLLGLLGFKLIYDLVLSRLESEEIFKNMSEKQ